MKETTENILKMLFNWHFWQLQVLNKNLVEPAEFDCMLFYGYFLSGHAERDDSASPSIFRD